MQPSPAPGGRLTLALFTLLIALLFADQNLMAPSLTAIGEELGFTRAQIDQKLGADVNLMFWMLGGVITLLIGYLADRGGERLSRKWLLVAVAFVGQLACLASGHARSYEALYWARALTGVGIGGAFPLIYSLLGDYFPPQRRASAAAVMGLSSGLGIAGGQLLSGMLLPSHGWRAAFLLVAYAGMAVNALYALCAREPRRGQHEQGLQALLAAGGTYEEKLQLRDLPLLLRTRTNLLLLLQALPGTVPWGVFFVYLNDFYAHDKHFPVPQATLLVMVIGAAAIAGSFVGGLLGQRVWRKNPRHLPLLCALSTCSAVPFMALLVAYPVDGSSAPSLTGPLLLGATTGFLAAMTGSNVNTMLINVNQPERRGTVFSLLNLANDLGRGLGAWFVGSLAARLGRVPAFHISNLLWLLCGAVLLVVARSYPRDEAAVQEQLARLAGRRSGGHHG